MSCPAPRAAPPGARRSARPLARPAALASALALALAACTPRAVVPDDERARLRAAFDGQPRYLRVTVGVHPLFGDASRRLLLDAPVGEVDLLRTAGGEVVRPPPAEGLLLPGTPVRVREIEFPSPLTIAGRVVMTPRYHPWAVLELGGDRRPHVVVLSQTAVTAADLAAELDRYLAVDDPAGALAALPPEQRDAVGRRELVEGMGAQAVEMAWGVPGLRTLDRPAGTEAWSWPPGKRKAYFADDRLVRWER